MQITLFTESLDQNSLGRTYCLWLLTKALGWESQVLTTTGTSVWSPLAGTEFADSCRVVTADQANSAVPRGTDLLIACKPLPLSLGVAIQASADRRIPLMVDVDDPDLESMLRIGRPLQRSVRALRRPVRTFREQKLRRVAMEHPCLVSNPWLQSRYGGTLIPHAREDVGAGRRATSRQPLIAFVGTNRQHKGMGVLRAAVDTLQSRGFTLVVTDTRPPDAKPWESWIGSTSFAEGMEVVRSADIVAIPSLRNRHSEGQLPAKLIDAMLLARAVVVTDVEPMPWAVAGTGLVVPAGSRDQLVKSLARLVDPALRDRLGLSARERALREFTVASLAGRFRDACLLAADTSPQARDD